MFRRFVLSAAFLLSACATDSGPVRLGENSFTISKQAATGFNGMGSLRADALREAAAQCASLGNKAVDVTSTRESQPPYVLGNFPRVDIDFRCV